MAETTIGDRTERTPILDRTINLAAVSWSTLAWIAILLVTIALRLPQLGLHTLSPGEAHLADDGYRLFRGATAGPNNQIADVGPVPVILNGLAIFLFGASDTAARIVPALLGILMVVAVLGLRPVIGNARALGAGALLALSPTAVYLSRTASRETFVAAFALFAVVAFVRLGVAADESGVRRWAIIFGASLGLMYGSGPSSLSVLLAIVLGLAAATLLDRRETNDFNVSLNRLTGSQTALLFFLAGLVVALVASFSLLFTDFSALAGLGSTVADWGRLLSTASSATPTQFFLLAILLYEILAVLFGIVTASRTTTIEPARLPWTFFAVWFAAALLIFSFSSGSIPEHAIHVALPLLILGGFGLGEVLAELDPRAIFGQRIGLLLLLLIGFLIAIFSLLVLLGRINNAHDQSQAVVEALAAFVLAVFPLGFGVYLIAREERAVRGGRRIAGIAILAVGTLLALFTLRSTIELSYFNADDSTELLAQQTSTPAVKQIVRRITNLSRDFTLTAGSARDPEGGHGLSIAIDKGLKEGQWPYRWYFRDFPDATVVAPGQAPQSGAQIVIAPNDTGMAEASYSPQAFPAKNRVPGNYSAPQFGNILRDIFFPVRWEKGVKFLLFRTGVSAAEPETVTVGMVGELSNAVTPNTGPFGLFDQVGAGNGRGQFNQPRGIAVSSDGEQIYVVDMSNARVEHFDATGQFIDAWGGGDGGDLTFGTANGGLGPTGIAVGPDGLIYACDTWNHRIVVLDESGRLVRAFGQFGDTQDAPDATKLPGSFFGPRAIAIYNDEIYVVDTGNERVQVFSLDGTFVRAWGGNGAGNTQFVEPVGIAIDGQGRVFVADSGNARIGVFTTAGAPLAEWPVAAWQGNLYFEPYLAFDDNGFLYATSSATGGIEVLDQNGQLVTEIHQVGSTRLQQPVGIAWSPEGDMLVSDKGRNAVFRLTPGTLPSPGQTTGEEASPEASPSGGEAGVVEPPTSSEIRVESSPVRAASPIAAASPTAEASPVGSPQGSPVASPVASRVASPTATAMGNG